MSDSDTHESEEQIKHKLIEAIDRLMESYRHIPLHPYEDKEAKRIAYRNVILDIAAQSTLQTLRALPVAGIIDIKGFRHDVITQSAIDAEISKLDKISKESKKS